MDNFIEYQRFHSLEDASKLTDLLSENNIPFKIDDSALRFDLSAKTINSIEGGIVIFIKNEDKSSADKLFVDKINVNSDEEHYLYSFSDNDLLEVIVNQEEWTTEEVRLAKQIAKQRNIKPTVEFVQSIKKENNEKEENNKQTRLISVGASGFLWIGIISIFNILTILLKQNLRFISGLAINDAIFGIMIGIETAFGLDLMILGYVIRFLISALFIWFWVKSKNHNKKIYLTGLIIYVVDTLLVFAVKDWFSFGFHLFALIFIYSGYKSLLDNLKIKN